MILREIAVKKGLNYRWLLWCDKTGHDPEKPFGGCQSNAEYMAWINHYSEAYMRDRGANHISNQEDFTLWLESVGQMELGL